MERKDFFESLFDRKTFYQRRMLLLLNSTNGRWVSSEWLGDQLGLSKRTTLNTINDLANQVARFRPDQFTFELSKSRGVSLNVENDADIYELITFIVKQCATVGMLESLLTEEFESVKSYAMRHFISESTVRRDLNKIQELLAD
jgi:transcriptional antiterminator